MNFANWPAPQPLPFAHCAFAVDAVVVLNPLAPLPVFPVKPWQPKLRRISVRKSNKNKALASEIIFRKVAY